MQNNFNVKIKLEMIKERNYKNKSKDFPIQENKM